MEWTFDEYTREQSFVQTPAGLTKLLYKKPYREFFYTNITLKFFWKKKNVVIDFLGPIS